MTDAPAPELQSAIKLAVIAELVLFAVGGALTYVTGELAWFIGVFIVGSALWFVLLARAGAFTKKND